MVRTCLGLLMVLPMVAGCGAEAATRPKADTLVLEVGNGHPSLSAALQEQARDRPLPTPEPGPTETPPEGPPVDPQPRPEPVPAPPPAAPRTILLKEGQTLYQVAAENLGSGGRYTEILALNGWTEDQARRLKTGTVVLLPAR